MLVEFCQLYQQITQQPIVQPAHMEIAEPTIAQAIGEQRMQHVHGLVLHLRLLSQASLGLACLKQ
jgi:hypothetical protein